jgi:GNAT superfamily N-acetyltransferase
MEIRPFHPTDQPAAKALIWAGLVEHWGWLDPTLNPDLDDIAASYAAGVFLVGYEGERLVATGALLPEAEQKGRIVRMSVDGRERRKGYGRALLHALLERAREWGYTQVVLETTTTWADAIHFYEANGFHRTHEADGDIHFLLPLD